MLLNEDKTRINSEWLVKSNKSIEWYNIII